jgi:hypothetical protein
MSSDQQESFTEWLFNSRNGQLTLAGAAVVLGIIFILVVCCIVRCCKKLRKSKDFDEKDLF